MPMATLLRPGDVLGGFKVDEVIGIGGMAIVYRAQQVSLGRAVALKVLSGEVSSDSHFRERFRREGTHAAALDHPNIVPVYDSGEEHGHLYLAMRLVEGTNLAELIYTRGITADNAVEILRPIASALDTAHAAGLIHRDVKPQNILIASNGHPYLADFGIAKGSNTQSLTATGGFVGSIHFASPEQINGLTLTPASDIYALTAVLFQCLTGRVPYPRDSDAGVMQAHLHDPPPTLPGTAESDFHSVLARGMAKDPGARYGHAGDLINAAALCVRRLSGDRRNSIPAFRVPLSDIADSATTEPQQEPQAAQTPTDKTIVAERAASTSSFAGALPSSAPTRHLPLATRAPRRGRRLIAASALITVTVIAGSVVLFSGGTGSAGATSLRTGNLLLSTPAGWRSAPGAMNGLALRSPVAAESAQEQVVGGALADPGPVAASLPASVTETLGAPSRSTVVKAPFGGTKLYEWSGEHQTPVAIYLIATDKAEYAVACSGRGLSARGTPANVCAEVLHGSRISDAIVEYPGPDPAVGRALSEAAEAREKTLAALRAQLSSADMHGRGNALRRVGDADAGMAKELSSIGKPGRYRVALTSLTNALTAEAEIVDRVGAAARSGDRGLYESLRAEGSSAARRLAGATAALAVLGFSQSVTAIHLLPAAANKARATQSSSASLSTPATTSEPVTPSVAQPSAPTSSNHSKQPVEVEIPQSEEK